MLDPIIPKSLIEAIKEVFKIQASTPVEIISASAITPGDFKGIDIVSLIGLISPQIEGTLALSFPKETYLGILNAMLAETFPEITRENADGAGELLNIVYGTARVKINEAGHTFQPAIPTVAVGSDIQVTHRNTPKIVRVECKTEYGPFFLEVSLRKR